MTKDDELVTAVARGIVASDFAEQRLGELTELPDPVEAARRMLDRARKLSALREAIKVYRREVRRAQRRASA